MAKVSRHILAILSRLSLFRFLKHLKLVAVDELHYYSGVFGRYAYLRGKPRQIKYTYQFAVTLL
jgi:hypothetical protein